MRNAVLVALLGLASAVACSGVACSGANFPGGFNTDGGTASGSGSGSGGSGSGGSGSGGFGSSSGGFGNNVGEGGAGSSGGDAGFVCAPNPLNYDIPGNGCDDDGDGTVNNVILCDSALPTGPGKASATQILNSMEICHAADTTHWGIVSASLTYGHTATAAGDSNFKDQYSVLTAFGSVTKAQEGASFGVLSSGTADVNDTDDNPPYFKGSKNGMQQNTNGDVPTGFPKAATGCQISSDVHDVVALKTQLKVPANAKGISFDFDFHSGEWPDYVCSTFNDSFIAYLTSQAFNAGAPGNISFDSKGNPVSVNIGFFGVCSPANASTGCLGGGTTGTASCAAGASALAGTGFDDPGPWCLQTSSGGGATGWLTSTAPVKPGETITLEFIIWDTGDNQYDSSVLLDYITWQPEEVPATPVTQPSPPPK